jgi:serine beta-lactamase-like protein LACTB
VADPRYASAIAAARAFLLDSMGKAGIPGAAVTVLSDTTIIWSEGLGWADVEQHVPATALTRWRIGSVSKTLTSAALGQLVEQGKIDLDAPVQRYVPSFPVKRWPVTIRELAGHTAGIRHYRGGEFTISRHYDTVLDGLAIFAADTLLFEPGTRYSYSSYGWNLLGAVIESASGEPFLSYMRGHVFVPLGLAHTVPEFADSLIEYRARFYERATAVGTVNAPYVDNSYKWAGGGFLSTTDDLARFGALMRRPGVVGPATLALLETSQHTSDGKETGYGMGWFVGKDAAGRRIIFHSGGAMGGTAYLLVYPDLGLVVAMLCNSDVSFVGSARRVAAIFQP